MAKISIGQQKILDRFRRQPGIKLRLDPHTGRYAFVDRDEKVTHVDQRPIEVMLRNGVLEKDVTGQCWMSAETKAAIAA